MTNLDNVPVEMMMLDNWCGSVEGDKRPYNLLGHVPANIRRPITWECWEQAVYTTNHDDFYKWLGFVLTKDAGFVVVDLDHCIDTETGEMNEAATKCLDRWSDAYYEVSKSGTGLHFIFKGSIESAVATQGVEMYAQERYIIITGNSTRDQLEPLTEFTKEDEAFVHEIKGETLKGQGIEDEFNCAFVRWNGLVPTLGNVPDGVRHNVLVQFAGLLKASGMDEENISSLMLQANQNGCTPPLEDSDVERMVTWIMSK